MAIVRGRSRFSINSRWASHSDVIRQKADQNMKTPSDSYKNWYTWVFEIADSESEVKIAKRKKMVVEYMNLGFS